MMINYRKLKPRPHYVREELLFVNGGFTLKTHPMLSVHTTQAEEFTNASIIGYFICIYKIAQGMWAYNRTLRSPARYTHHLTMSLKRIDTHSLEPQ